MAIQSDETLVTKGDLKTLYTDKILPYLGGNMMMQTGVSEYYSTNEKVVGVWLDGKPVYQKTIECGSLPNNTKKAIAYNISNLDKVVYFNGTACGKASDNKYYSFTFPNVGTANQYTYDIAIDITGDYLDITTQTDRTWLTGWVTLQYTKSTDTASSALTTPGCYDITRPDLWPVGQEIFFGNGLYGVRKTGTVTATADTRVWTDVITFATGVLPSIVQSGGWIKWGDEGQHDYKYPVNSAMTNLTGWGATLGAWSVIRTANSQIALWNTSGLARTDAPYDIWVTYTK